MTLLHQLYTEAGQSPWIDNLTRDGIRSGKLANMVDEGIRGVTSNPTIFQKAMTNSKMYDADFARLIEGGTVEQAFWEMATSDVTGALEILHPLYEQSGASDGFVSLEVSPRLAYDTEGTIKAARSFHEKITMPNLLVKIPATEEGLGAIETMIAEGRSINVTLIFSLARYRAVIAERGHWGTCDYVVRNPVSGVGDPRVPEPTPTTTDDHYDDPATASSRILFAGHSGPWR